MALAFNNLQSLNSSYLEGHLKMNNPYLLRKCFIISEIAPPTTIVFTPNSTNSFTYFSARSSSPFENLRSYSAFSTKTVPLVSNESN